MKTTKTTFLVGVATALAYGTLMMPIAILASDPGSAKGGATDLIKPMAPASDERVATMIGCPKCKSDWSIKTDSTARGVVKPTYATEKHACRRCETEIKTVGTGRQATQVAMHTCGTCAPAAK